jgi:hypothetical protein
LIEYCFHQGDSIALLQKLLRKSPVLALLVDLSNELNEGPLANPLVDEFLMRVHFFEPLHYLFVLVLLISIYLYFFESLEEFVQAVSFKIRQLNACENVASFIKSLQMLEEVQVGYVSLNEHLFYSFDLAGFESTYPAVLGAVELTLCQQ